jgi:hypothetical protein
MNPATILWADWGKEASTRAVWGRRGAELLEERS